MPSDKEKKNHIRLSRLLTDVGRRVLQDVFDRFHPPSNLQSYLASGHVYAQLIRLKARNVLHSDQWDTLYPPPGAAGSVSSQNFDITLIFLLLRTLCGLTPPKTKWDGEPLDADHSLEADLVRIKICRNELYAHKVEMALTDTELSSNWDKIEAALLRLGGPSYHAEIQSLKNASIDPEKDKFFEALLCEAWEESQDTVRWGGRWIVNTSITDFTSVTLYK